MPRLTKAGSSLTLEIFASKQKLGAITLGRGSLYWTGKGRHKSKRINWTHFAEMMSWPMGSDVAAEPCASDYVTAAETVPTPAPGQGVYYLTAATYQGQTRYGRKATAGHLSGRDPALLPACVQEP